MMAGDRALEISILGRRLRAMRAGAELENWLRARWAFPDPLSAHSRGEIDIGVIAEPPAAARRVTHDTVLDGVTLTWHHDGERSWRTGRREVGVLLALHAGGGRIRVWGAHGDAAGREMFVALHVAVCEALRASGLAPLHASVIVRDGRATALMGPSGSGKSTTLISAIEAGWSPLAEDFAWLDPVTRQIYGWDRGVRLSEDGVARLAPPWRDAAWRRDADGKLFLAYERIGIQRTPSAELTRIAVLQHDLTRDSGWEPLAARDAVRALWESTGVPLCPVNRADFARNAPTLLTSLNVSRLRLGTTPLAL